MPVPVHPDSVSYTHLIMISASHNPYYDNGIKVINGRGEKLEEETIEKIESYLDLSLIHI